MSIISAIKSVFRTVPAEKNFDAIAEALKNAYDIDMDYLDHVEGYQYIINLSKGNLKLRFTIPRDQYEDGHYEQIFRMNVDRFLKELEQKNALYTEDELLKAATRKAITMSGKNANIVIDDEMNAAMDSIVLDDLKKFKDTVVSNITKFSKDDLDEIQRMKEAARKIGAKGNNPIIAGGFFASIFWNQEPRDIDVFYLDGDGEDFHTPGALKDGEYLKNPMITKVASFSVTKRQFIFTKYKTRRELVDHFDMLHCCVSYDVKEDKLYISPAALEAIKYKSIIPNGKNKIAQWRLDKMMKRGWTMVPE